MSLITKHRPSTLDELAGNERLVKTLSTVMSKPRADIPHTFLFIGNPGCGKTTLGRIVSSMLGCKGLDYMEIDSVQFRGIDTVREIQNNMWLSPVEGDCRVWLLDEVHMLGVGGASEKNVPQNGLLKALEDAPPHVYFILCTTNPEMLLDTIKSRCMLFEVQPLVQSDMENFLKNICRVERKRVPFDVLEQIAMDSLGSCRNALSVLDKIIDLDPAEMKEVATQEAAKQSQVIELCRALFQRAKWKDITKILTGLEKEPVESVRIAVFRYCSGVLLSGKDVAQAYIVMDCFRKRFSTTEKGELVLAAYEAVDMVGQVK